MKSYDTRIEGMGTLPKGTYTTILVEGIGSASDDLQFEVLKVDGTFKAKGALHGDVLKVNGMLKANAAVKVKDLSVDGVMQVKESDVYADEIDVSGMLKSDGEISADQILVDGCIQASMLSGDIIRLNYHDIGKMNMLTSIFGGKKLIPGVERIECTSLHASYLRSHHICAQEVHLTSYCEVDVIECDGIVSLDHTCRVKEMRGDFTLI